MRRGGLLLEVLVSIAIFVAAAAFCVRATSDSIKAMERSDLQLVAADLARSAMTQLEAGNLSLADLRDGRIYGEELDDQRLITTGRWQVEADTRPSLRPRLTVITLTVTQDVDTDSPVQFVLRELIELRESEAGEWEQDEILDDLPEVSAPEDAS
ncbi:MAG: hypothetical protein CMJ39_01365 [Phycisphaerae bacterium]|nr:hypothetical protein [Phycisphaerae bacterium]|tara:strand:+ start:1242 stop:1706 length:465 start_codon:yes stop_codon:yes gene_type:complete